MASFLLAFACIASAVLARAEGPQPWRIAVVGPMSGDSAQLGRAMVDAAQIRVDEVNATGGLYGRPVELVEYDDRNEPETAAQIAETIARDSNALLVLGHRTSGASLAASPVYKQYEIPAISGTATADALTADNPWYFRVIYNNGLQADFIANYINSILKYKYATLVYTSSAYGKSLANAFTNSVDRLPLTITHRYELDASDPDIDLSMTEVIAELSLAPDSGMIFLAMDATNAAHFVREMRNSGFTFPLFGADSINQQFPSYFQPDVVLKTSPGDFTDQIYATTSIIWDVARENAIQFRNAYRGKHGGLPDSGMALYFDAATVALSAVANAKLSGTDLAEDRKRIRDYLASVDSPEKAFDGITGQIST